MAAVKVQFEIGHTSKLRNKKTAEGFTHDWEIYVQGINKSDISIFVDKVVFNLHDSFPKPKRVCKDPPFSLQESGYAGFLMPIDIYFRNRDEPKRFQFTYDLDLQQTGPPHHRCEVKKFIFECPSDEFRHRLLKGGGIPVSGVSSANTINAHNSTLLNVDDNSKLVNYDLNTKKHKLRTDENKINAFANLFGTPITKNIFTKCSPERKNSGLGSSYSATNLVSANSSDSTTNTGASVKEKSIKEREKVISNMEIEKKDKSEKHEKNKRTSPYKDLKNEKKSLNHGSKNEKRNDEKPKRDKPRDREKERNKERFDSSMKRANSSQNLREVDLKSPKRQSPLLTNDQSMRLLPIGNNTENSRNSKNKFGDELKVKEVKLKIENSSSSGKKSKKEKKDKDKDREKDKRDEHKEKHRNSNAKTKDDNVGHSIIIGQTNTVENLKETKCSSNSNRSIKKTEKDVKSDIFKTKNVEKFSEKEIVQEKKYVSNSRSIIEKDKKSHKHKKKEKNRDKDKERDKNKDRLKEKQKYDEISNKKKYDNTAPTSIKNKITEAKSSQKTKIAEQSNIHPSILYSDNNVNSLTSTSNLKKSHNREKKVRDKTILEHLQRNVETEKKKKILTNTVTSTFPSNSDGISVNEHSDVNHKTQQKNSPEAQQLLNLKSLTANAILHQNSENSNSNSSDLFDNKKTISNKSDSIYLSKKEKKFVVINPKESKLQTNEKSTMSETHKRAENQNKDEKKRSSTISHFVEPPVKQLKKEQIVKSTEKSKSPNFRDLSEHGGSKETKASIGLVLTPINFSNAIAAPTTIGTITTSDILLFKPSVPSLLPKSDSPIHALNVQKIPIATSNNLHSNEYLCELQHLHQKIMTLQGNEELQHVVEMIAATGCYEITAKTFDFDLCKLDRSTVQKLQEFLASSMS